ncbi:MAG: exodeoxyribonuclease VII large subunit [Clostridium sp.]|nr:exodeoxyribonuclease VII large subunit [Clostridium sp.]
MANVYSVSQVNAYIRNMFAQDYALSRISVTGEVSNLKYHSSGHIYFTLKDGGAAIACVMFAGKRAKGLDFRMEEGQKVIAEGSVEVYVKSGQYQLYANRITRDGQGDLFRRYEELKNRLEEMGMFAPEYKKPIPPYVRTVGIVTASTGAAIHDIMNISARRNPYVQLILCPAKVQGEGAAESIARAVERLDALGTDVMIVGRGGGSIEDLWAFNEEVVARAIFACRTPVISAVGHETDFTIADYVADLRAPTPSAAAELAVFDYSLFLERLEEYRRKITRGAEMKTGRMRDALSRYRLGLLAHSPERELNSRRQALSDMTEKMEQLLKNRIAGMRRELEYKSEQMERGMQLKLTGRRQRLQILAGRLDGRSPIRKISGGYGFVTNLSDMRIDTVEKAVPGEGIRIRMRDGRIGALVTEVEKTWQNS